MLKNPEPGGSTRQIVQVLIISAVAILLVGGALVGLLNAQVGKLQRDADNKQAEVGSSEQVAKRFELTLASYDDTINRIKYLETSVTAGTYVPTMLQQIQTLAGTTHLNVQSIRPGPIVPTAAAEPSKPAAPPPSASPAPAAAPAAAAPAKKKAPPPYDTMNISLQVSGTFSQTAAFLFYLTQFPKIVAVMSAQMHPMAPVPGANPTASPMVSTTLQLVAYVFHDDTAPIAIPGITDTNATSTTVSAQGDAPPGIPPAPAAGTFAAAAQRAVAGATADAQAARAKNEVGVGTL